MYTSPLHNVLYQLFINKSGEKKKNKKSCIFSTLGKNLYFMNTSGHS